MTNRENQLDIEAYDEAKKEDDGTRYTFEEVMSGEAADVEAYDHSKDKKDDDGTRYTFEEVMSGKV